MGEKVATSPSKVADTFCWSFLLIETPVNTLLSIDIEYQSVKSFKIEFVKLWDSSGYSERKTSKRPSCQKLVLWGKLSLRY